MEGYALGGGMELALICDFIIASENAKFAREMISLSKIHDMPLPHEVRTKIGVLEIFYALHIEKYPQ